MYWLNKVVWGMMNPCCLGFLGLVCGCVLACRDGSTARVPSLRKAGRWLLGGSILWMWFWASGVPFWWWQKDVVREFPPQVAEAYPVADAIVDLGGGMGCNEYELADGKKLKVPEIRDAADRVWFSAQLWKAGKAPVVIPSLMRAEEADAVLLEALGVPKSAILLESAARNTEENAKLVQKVVSGFRLQFSGFGFQVSNNTFQVADTNRQRPRILLVTSAWHMKRSLLMFRKYAPELEVIPAPTDHSGMGTRDFELLDLLPSAGGFMWNNVFLHEVVGYWWYRIFR